MFFAFLTLWVGTLKVDNPNFFLIFLIDRNLTEAPCTCAKRRWAAQSVQIFWLGGPNSCLKFATCCQHVMYLVFKCTYISDIWYMTYVFMIHNMYLYIRKIWHEDWAQKSGMPVCPFDGRVKKPLMPLLDKILHQLGCFRNSGICLDIEHTNWLTLILSLNSIGWGNRGIFLLAAQCGPTAVQVKAHHEFGVGDGGGLFLWQESQTEWNKGECKDKLLMLQQQ